MASILYLCFHCWLEGSYTPRATLAFKTDVLRMFRVCVHAAAFGFAFIVWYTTMLVAVQCPIVWTNEH